MQPLFPFLFTRCWKVKGSKVKLKLRTKLLQVQVTTTSTRLSGGRWGRKRKAIFLHTKFSYLKKFFPFFCCDFPLSPGRLMWFAIKPKPIYSSPNYHKVIERKFASLQKKKNLISPSLRSRLLTGPALATIKLVLAMVKKDCASSMHAYKRLSRSFFQNLSIALLFFSYHLPTVGKYGQKTAFFAMNLSNALLLSTQGQGKCRSQYRRILPFILCVMRSFFGLGAKNFFQRRSFLLYFFSTQGNGK